MGSSKKPLHVGLAITNLGLGGAQKQAVLLAESLESRGIRVTLLLTQQMKRHPAWSNFTTPIPVKLVARDAMLKHPLLAIGVSAIRGLQALSRTTLATRLASQLLSRLTSAKAQDNMRLETISPNVVRLCTLRPGTILAARGIADIAHRRQLDAVLSLLPLSNFASIVGTPKTTTLYCMERNDPGRQHLPKEVTDARQTLYQYADVIGANSHTGVDWLRKKIGITGPLFLPNRIEATTEPDESSERTLSVLVVGRLEPRKRTLETISALQQSKLLREQWRVTFFGTGPLEGRARAMVKSSGNTSIVIAGSVPSESIPYAHSQFLILNSDAEGSPNVVLEAMGNGCVPLVRTSATEALGWFPSLLRSELSFNSEEEMVDRLDILGSDAKRVERARLYLLERYEQLFQESSFIFEKAVKGFLEEVRRRGNLA